MSRTLPSSPLPIPGEALDGYLDRVSVLHGVPAKTLSSWVGIERTATTGIAVKITNSAAATIEEGFGWQRGTASAMTLNGAFSCLLPSLSRSNDGPDIVRAAAKDWFFVSGSRYCGRCLETNGVWRLSWRLPWVVDCDQCGTPIDSACPTCGGWPRSGTHSKQSSTADWGSPRASNVCFCSVAARDGTLARASRPCGARLTQNSTGKPLPWYSTRVEQALNGQTSTVAGIALPPDVFLTALRELIVLHWRHVQGANTRRPYRTPPKNADVVRNAAVHMRHVICADTVIDAATALIDVLDPETTVTGHTFRDALGKQPVLQPLYGASLRLTGRLSTRLRRTVEDPLALYRFGVQHIPQLAWTCCIPAVTLKRPTGPSPNILAAVISLAAARHVTPDWASASTALSFPPTAGRQWVRYAADRLDKRSMTSLYRAASTIATTLDRQTNPTRYDIGRTTVLQAADLAQAQRGDCTQHTCQAAGATP